MSPWVFLCLGHHIKRAIESFFVGRHTTDSDTSVIRDGQSVLVLTKYESAVTPEAYFDTYGWIKICTARPVTEGSRSAPSPEI